MIRFFKATRPSRKRERNGRYILQIGKRMFHMSWDEAASLEGQMNRVLIQNLPQDVESRPVIDLEQTKIEQVKRLGRARRRT